MSDQLKKYLFQDRTVRVQAVRLAQTWKNAQEHHDYPPAVLRLLGEMVAASTLLAASIKFEGALLLQIQGDGPIALLVVECRLEQASRGASSLPSDETSGETADTQDTQGQSGDTIMTLRATVKVREGRTVPADGTMQSLLNARGGGRFIVLLDPKRKTPGQQPYQGIVPLEGDTVAEALEHYMKASEQIDTRLWLAADAEHACGLLVQRLPDEGGDAAAADSWERAVMLADTLKTPELLQADTDTLIHRLYWEETLIVFKPQGVAWQCSCTRERVADMLRSLGQAEVDDIVREQGKVEVSCDFCGKPYLFDAIDAASLFSPGTSPGSSTLH